MTETSVLGFAPPSAPPPDLEVPISPPESQPKFLTDEEIEELAVKLALNGASLGQGLTHLENARKTKVDALEQECKARTKLLEKRIEEQNTAIEKAKAQVENLAQKIEELRHSKRSTEIEIQLLHLRKSSIRLNMRIKQLEAEKQFFQEEREKLTTRHHEVEEKIAHEKENELEYAKQLHTKLLNIWDIDQEELRRRAVVFEEEESRVSTLLKEVEEKIRYLRQVGISRTTGGFLVWVGYTAFAGVGSVVAFLLQRRLEDPKSADFLGNLIRGFASFFGAGQGQNFSWIPFGQLMAFVFVVLLLVASITLIADRVLKRFNPKWQRISTKREKNKNAKNVGGRWQNVLGILTAGSDRLSLFTGQVTRDDYSQLLAVGPYLVLAAVIVFLVSALGLSHDVLSGSAPASTTLTTASIGAIFTLLSTSVCLLYVTKIIEPRRLRALQEPDRPIGFGYHLKLNWEILLVAVLMIAAILIVTFAPFGKTNDYRAWGLLALFMVLGSVGLCYGLIYRGTFRDYDFLTRRREEFLSKIQSLVLKPTLADVIETSEPEDLKETADKYRRALEYLEALWMDRELNGIFGSSLPSQFDGFSRLWFEDLDDSREQSKALSWSRRYGTGLSRLIRSLGRRLKAARESDPPTSSKVALEETEQYRMHDEQIEMLGKRISDLDKEVAQASEERLTTESKISDLKKVLRDYETRLWTAQTDCARKTRNYDLQKQRDEIKFTSAFLTGKLVYEFVREPIHVPATNERTPV